MRQQISHVSVLQTSKIVAILYALFGLVMVPLGCVILALNTGDRASLVLGVLYLLGPVLYGVLGFILTAIGIWVYNLVAPRLGGIEFDLTEVPQPPAS